MRVIVEDAVFATSDAKALLDLDALVRLSFEGRHRLLLTPDMGPCFTEWRAAQPPLRREVIDIALKASLDAESRVPSRLSIRILASPGTASTRSPAFSLADALVLLEEPFRILVEDIVNDRAFLLATACPEDRKAVIHAEQQRWLRFENGGGLSGIRRLFAVTQPSGGLAHPHQRLRVFIVFDSDRLALGAPSKKSDDLTTLCCEKNLDTPLRFRQLARRCIENYLPRRALEDWQGSTDGRLDRAATYAAWITLRPEHTHFFNMKAGFRGDHKQLVELTKRGYPVSVFEHDDVLYLSHYQDLSPEVRSSLLSGFDKNIGQDFHTKAEWYEQHPSWRIEAGLADEFDGLFRDLLGAL